MSRLFVGNFDFESTLPAGQSMQIPAALQRIVAELAPAWVAVAETGDMIWCPEPIDPRFFEKLQQHGFPDIRAVSQAAAVPSGLELAPWGWTEEVLRWGRSVGATVNTPPLESVRTANSRRFSHQWEQETGSGLPGAAIVESVPELFAAIGRLPPSEPGWVVKAEFSNSSRERFLHRVGRPSARPSARPLDGQRDCHAVDVETADRCAPDRGGFDRDALRRWAVRRLGAGHALFVEPWVDRVDEVGVQLTVPPTGEPCVEGVTRLLTDVTGHYEGNVFAPTLDDEPHWRAAVAAARDVATALQRTGYFGPLGIDAMRYRDAGGNIHLRAIQDINARWTMGRLSLGFRRLLGPGEQGTWFHGRVCDGLADAEHGLSRSCRTIPTSPADLGGRPVQRRSAVVISSAGFGEGHGVME